MIRWVWGQRAVITWVGILLGLALIAYLMTPKEVPDAPLEGRTGKSGSQAKALISKFKPSNHDEVFIKTPPQSRVLSGSSKTKDRVKESTMKLESWLSPTELQVYYTDILVRDWMIARDDLTEGVGWSGVFLQIEPKEKSMGIFAVVKRIGPASGQANPTIISIIKVEEF